MRRIAHTFATAIGVTLALVTPAMPSGSHGSGSVSADAGTRVVLTLKGRGVAGDSSGTFALEAANGVATDSGTMRVGADISGLSPRPVPGHLGWQSRAVGHATLRGKQGALWLSLSESYISVNASNVYTGVSTGTWRIRRGTGIYESWHGSGQFVSADRRAPSPKDRPSGVGSYEARFVGLVRR